MTEMELVERIERLERGNRRIKRLALAAVILVTALTFVYAERPAPQKLTAHELDLVDSAGHVRIVLVSSPLGPAIVLSVSDPQGKPRAVIGADPDGSPGIALFAAQDKSSAMMQVGKDGSPSISLSDPQGFELDLGSTSTVTATTGQTQRTSAASIVMFGNDKGRHVIWQAP